MKAVVMSDIHAEFHPDRGKAFLRGLENDDVDAIVVAGDLTTSDNLFDLLGMLCERFEHVIYVLGNHEYYHTNRLSLLTIMDRCVEEHSNLHWLNNNKAVIDGQRFLGSTLWFPRNDDAPKDRLNDFHLIMDSEKWVYHENGDAVLFLTKEMRRRDIVVTHHLPSRRSIHAKFKGDPLNAFFYCGMDGLINEKAPGIWIHGHTHHSFDYHIGGTRVVCNPFGYMGHEQNHDFDAGMVVDISDR